MKKSFLISAFLILAGCLLIVNCSNKEPGDDPGNGGEEDPKPENFSFAPNQTAASPWYKPGGSLVNGHLDESFGSHPDLWPQLIDNLKKSGGSFSLFAAEIGHMSTKTGLIPLMRKEGIPISVEVPAMTQCIPGRDLAEAELNGKAVNGTDNIFRRIFLIHNPADRPDPDGKGWFYTNDREHFIPDEILFDERQPNLCPEFDPVKLANTPGTWDQRKDAARKNNYCAYFGLPFNDLLAQLRQDYIDYLTVAKAKWGDKMPDFTIHWNVVAGWEWRDENAIDAVHKKYPNYFDNPDNFWKFALQYPQYNSVEYCNALVDALIAAGFTPKRILMDVDWIYSIPYIKEVLTRHKAALKARGIQMGINVVEASTNMADNEELFWDGRSLIRRTVPGGEANVCYENTLIAIMKFLKGSGIYEEGMQIRVTSWNQRPKEKGAQINENTPGSMAHIANGIFDML